MAFPTVPSHPPGMSHRFITFVATHTVFTFLSVLCVTLRFWQRRMIGQFSWDDWSILGSLACSMGMLITTIVAGVVSSAGYHINTYSLYELEEYIKISLADSVIYNVGIMLSKVSVLCFYYRIFSINRRALRIMQILAAINLAACISAVLGLIFAHTPVQGQWNLSIPSKSINLKPFWVTLGTVTFFLDVAILTIPQSLVWKLQLSRQRRLAVSLVFLLGGFVCVTSIVRVISLARVNVSDSTYSMIPPSVWTVVEINTSIICACLPIIYCIFNTKKRNDASCVNRPIRLLPRGPVSSDDMEHGYPNMESNPSDPSIAMGYRVSIQCSDDKSAPTTTHTGPIRIENSYSVS